MDADFAECLQLYRSGQTAECISSLVNILAARPDDPDARFLLALASGPTAPAGTIDTIFDNLLRSDRRTGDDYDRVGQGLRAAGLEKLATVAFSTAAALDRGDPERPHAWGDKPFNGQTRRAELFQRLMRLIDVAAVVETGTFRGTTTMFMHEVSGVDVYSCELSDRYFDYASARMASATGIHLYKEDSRDFLAHLSKDSALTKRPVFFYLDAHWNAEFPLVDELRIVARHFEQPIIMIDDFEVPDRADYHFDDYGEDAVLSIDILEPVLSEETSLFYPNWAPDEVTSSNRGFVILARGDVARHVATLTEYVTAFDRFHAVMRQMRRYRRTLRQIASDLDAVTERLHAAERERQQDREASELAQANAATAAENERRAVDRELNAARRRRETLQYYIEKLKQELASTREGLTAQNEALITQTAALNAQIQALDAWNEAMNARNQALDKALSEALNEAAQARHVAAEQLAERDRQLTRIYQSTVWRRTRWLVRQVERARRLRQRPLLGTLGIGRRLIAPEGSRRGTAYAVLARPLVRALLSPRPTAPAPRVEPSPPLPAVEPPPPLPAVEPSPPLPAVEPSPPLPAVEPSPPLPAVEPPPPLPAVEPPPPLPAVEPPPVGEPSLRSPLVYLGPLKFIPHDGGFFSNFNFLVGEMYLGRVVYPLFTYEEVTRHSLSLRHFAYFDHASDNTWFEFFQPIAYTPDDTTHLHSRDLIELPESWGQMAAPEFRFPAATMQLYAREDFADWRAAVHDAVADKLRVADDIRETIDRLLARMPGRRIGVHVRHPSHLVEQGSIFFASYFAAIDAIRERHPDSSVFLATDNDLAIASFRMRYGDALFCHSGFIRQSIDDVLEWAYSLTHAQADDMGFVGGVGFQTHYKLTAAGGGADGVRSGKEAVADVFTLAACDDFVCTASNFTLTCAFLNPKQTQHLISKGVG